MVKSYQGARQSEDKTIKQYLVKDYMTTQVISFKPEQSIDEVVRILTYRSISGGPVLDENKKLVGIISEGDCLKYMMNLSYSNVPSHRGVVKDYMVEQVEVLNPEQTILQAAEQFLEMKLRRFPVIEDGKLLGQLSQRDVMRAFQDME